jgi:penicillin amidase
MSTRNLTLAGILAAAIAAPIAGLAYLWRRPLPILNGTLKLRGLNASVEVIRDKWGVPHIYAQNDDDIFFVQGFVHAQDRLWHMELNRRLASGTLSEIVGAVAYDTDRWQRVIGLRRAAENDFAHASENARRILHAYARGVNAFLETNQKKLPLEFTLLRYTPAAWQPQDTLVWAKMMSWGLGQHWDAELLRAAMLDKLGPQRLAELMDEYPRENPIILPGQTPLKWFDQLAAHAHASKEWLAVTAPFGMSNNWVVDGTKSETGKPLLANDPHLNLQMPSLWYEVHLITPEWQAQGVSLPGVPGVVLGHNAEIAWGCTNGFPDVQDLYVEKFNPADPQQYEFQGQWETAQIVREAIRVKGEANARVVNVTLTRHGPLLNDLMEWLQKPDAPKLALRWIGYEPGRLIDAAYGLLRAKNWDEFTTALRDWTDPAQNFVYADRAGNIGYYLAGRVPIRKQGIGATPVPGWTGEYEWTGDIPFAELPHLFNPPQHYVVTANNQLVGAEYPHHLTLDTMNGFRAKRVEQLLNEKAKLNADDYARMHVDEYCAPAAQFVKLTRAFREQLLQHPALRERGATARAAFAALDAWDLQLTADSVAGAIYETTLYFAMQRIFKPWLGELTDHFIGVGFHPLLHAVSAFMDRGYIAALDILDNAKSQWLRDENGKPRTSVDILAGAFADAFRFLETNVALDMKKWQWGKLHRATFKHPLGAVKPLDKIFNRGPYPYGGDTSTVWQGAFVPTMPISDEAVFTASWRQILDVGDWDASRGIHTTGQSGHPASRHFADMIPLWLKGEYHPLWWTREKILENREGILRLETGE